VCELFQRVVAEGAKCQDEDDPRFDRCEALTVDRAELLFKAFGKQASPGFKTALFYGTLMLAIEEFMFGLAAGKTTSPRIARRVITQTMSGRSNNSWWWIKFLVETARRESRFNFTALNKGDGDDGYWQLIPMTRNGLEKFNTWMCEPLPAWPDRRKGRGNEDFVVTPYNQAVHVGHLLIRILAVLGTFVDWSGGGVPVAKPDKKKTLTWQKRIDDTVEKLAAANLPVNGRSVLFAFINNTWARGSSGTWGDGMISKGVKMVRVIQRNQKW
jgi:hypothetical protein